jgi:hypothetical protein
MRQVEALSETTGVQKFGKAASVHPVVIASGSGSNKANFQKA